MASSLCQVKIGAGAYAAVAGGINVSPGDVITIKLVSSAGVDTGSWSISCVYTDETKVPATITALLTVNQTTFEATFTVPAGTGQALIFRSQVNLDSTTRTTFGLYTLYNGLRCGAVDETYEGDATYGWVTKVNAAIRATGTANGQIQGAAVAVAAMAIDWSLGVVFTKTLAAGANVFTFSNQASGMVIVVRVTGAASTLAWPTVLWAGGVAPTQTASGTDIYTFVHDGTSIYGSVVQAMA